MNNTSTLFAGLRNAKTSERGVWLKPGQYVVRVKRGIYKVTRKSGDAFILEFLIERSNYESEKRKALEMLQGKTFDMAELEKLMPNQAGSSASWYQSLKDIDIGYGSLKGFAASILGCEPEAPEFIAAVEGFMAAVCQTPGAIDGMLIPVEVVMTETKKKEDFSRHNWGQIIREAQAAAQ
jgi:hypothetical protein